MIKFVNLYSGSSGNSSLLITDNSKILIDAGESSKKIIEGLKEFNLNITDIDAILLSHEHTDHAKALPVITKNYDIPVYSTEETFKAFEKSSGKEILNQKNFTIGKRFHINDVDINAFSIPHDAANPCGFNIFKDGVKLSVVTDLGHITKDVFDNIKDSKFLMIESNYDLNILRCSKYPYYLKQRISGPLGHLSNEDTGDLIVHLMNSGLEKVELAHLSKENNFPELAYKTVTEKLIESKIDMNKIHIDIASNKLDRKIIEI